MPQTVFRSSLTEQVYMLIIKKIKNNELLQGDRLHIEELAKEFDVSRTPVREAINRLSQEGIAEQIHNTGPRLITLNKQQMLDLIFTNATLVTGILELLEKSTDQKQLIAVLANIIENQRQSLQENDDDNYFSYDSKFHKVLIYFCSNQKLKQLALQTQAQIDMFVLCYLRNNLDKKKNLNEHIKMINYLIKGDYENLITGMKEHNLSARFYLETNDILK